jgi:hypothetical protein
MLLAASSSPGQNAQAARIKSAHKAGRAAVAELTGAVDANAEPILSLTVPPCSATCGPPSAANADPQAPCGFQERPLDFKEILRQVSE